MYLQGDSIKLSHAVGLLITTIAVVSCVTVVDRDSRNTDGSYDGWWYGVIGTSKDEFQASGWTIKCADASGILKLVIADGSIEVEWRNQYASGYIGDNGNFRVVLPNNASRFVFDGRLDDDLGFGRWTHAFAELGNHGCNAAIEYRKVGGRVQDG